MNIPTSVQTPLFIIILLWLYAVSYKTNYAVSYKTNLGGFTVRLARPKLWNAINTDVRNKQSLNAYKTAYKKAVT